MQTQTPRHPEITLRFEERPVRTQGAIEGRAAAALRTLGMGGSHRLIA